MVYHITPSVSSLSECSELFLEFLQIFIGLNDDYKFATYSHKLIMM